MLAVAIFAIGFVVASSIYKPQKQEQQAAAEHPATVGRDSSADERIADYTLALAWLTGVLAVSTVGLWVVTWRSGVKQSRDTRIIERAYINVVTPCSELRFDQQGNLIALRVWVIWKNVGKTPAFPMFGWISATFSVIEQDFRFGRPEGVGVGDPMVLGPTAEFTSGHIDIGAEHVHATAGGAGHQFFWGEARYHDNFPGSPAHIMEFCYRVEIEGVITPAPGMCRVRFNLYGEHNRYYDES